jgi:2-isopropylmalate synthase
VTPESVGNRRRVLVSDQAGKSNLIAELERLGVPFDKADRRLDGLLSEVKEREARGFAYEAADASFDLLARRHLGAVPAFFEVKSYRTMVERRYNARGEIVTVSEAVVKLKIDGETVMSVAEGNGPVNALDQALRKDLGKYQSEIETLELVDFKVRILNGGTGAVTRVLIESLDRGSNRRWSTIGVSENIIDASFQALIDSITYKLLNVGAA